MKTKMMIKTVKTCITFVFACATLVTISCSSGDDSPEDELITECNGLDEIIAEYSEATDIFFNNQTENNCEALRTKALELIEKIETCPQVIDQYDAIQEAAQEWREVDCSEFD
ncbi:hypothetical protein [Winogradskyella sp. A3E31]|uniref:hypothetical protein n=1 Tax=Winogradskyella sp. A3E31 TaxID=3349637 RepID=UPI00398ABE0E